MLHNMNGVARLLTDKLAWNGILGSAIVSWTINVVQLCDRGQIEHSPGRFLSAYNDTL